MAESAEEQVDAFLLKPFSAEDFSVKLNEVLDRKINPSPYMVACEEGKKLLEYKQFDKAAAKFISAKPLVDKPSFACYFAGQSFLQAGDRVRALVEFQEGLGHQPLHYKCLIGAFDVLITEKRYNEAFDFVKLLKDNYPLTPRRLSQIFIVSVLSHHFDDVKTYYGKYLELEQRTPEMTKVVSMALYTAGKHYLEKQDKAEAVAVFELGATSVGRNFQFMEKVVDEMIKASAFTEAQAFAAKVSMSDRGTPAHNRLAFKVDAVTLDKNQVVERGRKLIMTGEGTPEIYELVVRIMAETGKTTLAESVIARAVADHPEMRASLYKILESSGR